MPNLDDLKRIAEVEFADIVKNTHQVEITPMLGFLGTFSVNFEIPDYRGTGKSVSRGVGTVKRVDTPSF